MDLSNRYNSEKIRKDLEKKMVFLGGPRQVGKTSLAEKLLQSSDKQGVLLNWDDDNDRTLILKRELPIENGIIVFDELHKNRKWRNFLKGLYDKKRKNFQILVTGSARLDLYRYGGDSLQGRYFYHRLHPFTVKELGLTSGSELNSLLALSGFPEPYFSQSETEKQRWSNAYRTRLVREDLRDLEQVVQLSTIELLSQRLPALVGLPLSVNALRKDLQVNHATVENWLSIFERLYYIYRVPPFGPPKIRAVKKLTKHYHFDWSLPPNDGAKFENFIAGHLLKWCNFQEDTAGKLTELKYYRDSQGREVDFVITENEEPILLIEVKLSQNKSSVGLNFLKSKYPDARAILLSKEPQEKIFTEQGVEKLDALTFLQELI